MKRAFLLLLLLILLLLSALLQSAREATVFHGGNILGSIPLWQLRHALPRSIFAAGAFMVAIGTGAQFWLGLLPSCGAGWTPTASLRHLSSCGLWCGWLILSLCTLSLPDIFPGEEAGEAPFFSPEVYLLLQAGFIPMALCHALRGKLRQRLSLVAAFVSAGVALACGLLWWHDRPLDFLTLSLVGSPALLLLLPGLPSPKVGWLFIASLALAAYALVSRSLILSYLPSPHAEDKLPLAVGTAFALLALLPICLPALRRASLLRAWAGCALLLAAGYNLCALVASRGAGGPPLPGREVVVCYLLALITVALLSILRFLSLRPKQKSSQNEFGDCNQAGKGVD